MALTGCLHEDGLADTADGFGGGATRERKLDIMRDSRIGAYGVCALVVSILIRAGVLASLAEPGWVAWALIAAHGAGRATLPVLMFLVPPARADGLSVTAGQPPREQAIAGAVLGVLILFVCLGFEPALIAAIAARDCGGAGGAIEHRANRRPDRRCVGRAGAGERDCRLVGRGGVNSPPRSGRGTVRRTVEGACTKRSLSFASDSADAPPTAPTRGPPPRFAGRDSQACFRGLR